MKYLLSVLLSFLLLPIFVQGQPNLVHNGNFEQYDTCLGSIVNVVGWGNYNGGTSDYFNTCNSNRVPANSFGFQYPASGNAYIGLSAFNSYVYQGREYVTSSITPMQIGAQYEVSLSMSVANRVKYFSDGLNVHFFDTGYTQHPVGATRINLTPLINFSNYGVITDTQNWVRLSAIFTADSAYDRIAIGYFLDTPAMQYVPSNFLVPGISYSYTYIDSVVVKLAKPFGLDFQTTTLCVGDTIKVPYFVNNVNSFFKSNNIFILQLSNSSGSFTNPVNIGSIASTSSDTVVGVIPTTTVQDSGYRLRMISSNGTDTTFDNGWDINIYNPDSSAVSVTDNSPICEGNTLGFSASTNVSSTTYSWIGPSGFNSTLQNPVINGAVPANSGDYYATLKFHGCEVKDTLSVTVKPLPANPVANNNSPLCAGDSLHLSSTSSTGGVSYSWTGPGSFSSAAQDSSIANSTTAMSGDYIVTANLNGCNRNDTTTVLVKPLPAAVTLSNNGPLCAGDTVHLSSTASTTGVSYGWTGPGSFTANTQDTNRANSTAGMTGWYKMLVGLNGCTYADSTYATIHPIPAVPNISHSNPLCVGETLNLGTTTVSGASYSWSGPGNFSAAVQNPARSNMQFGDTGMYKLTTTVNGCTSDTGTASVHINPLPFVVIFANPADSICQGDRVNFTALPNNHGGTPVYQWYVNAQASGGGTVFSTTTLNHQDVIRCDMTESTKCSAPYTDPSNDITMNVLPWLSPTVSISVSPNRPLKENEYVTFTATATNAGNNPLYQWKRNGQDIVGATGSVWSANTLYDNDSISVEIISSYKCPQPTSAVSNGIVVKVLTGVGGLSEVSGLMLYPNPNNGKFVLKGEALANEILNLEIINAMGQVVYRDEVDTDNNRFHKEINVPDISPGIYLLKLQGRNGAGFMRFNVLRY